MEDREIAERILSAGLVDLERRFEGTRRRCAGVDLGVALVDRQHGVVLAAETQQVLEIVLAGDRALRIGRGAEIDDRHPPPGRLVETLIVRQEAVRGLGVDQQRLAARQDRAAQIGLVERVGQRDDRLGSALLLRRRHRRDDVDAFLAARRRMDVHVRIEQALGQLVAPRQPFADREIEVRQALVRRIAVPAIDLVDHDLAREGRHRALRLADRHVDHRQVRRRGDRGNERVQPREWEVGQRLGQARIEHSRIQWAKTGPNKATVPTQHGQPIAIFYGTNLPITTME